MRRAQLVIDYGSRVLTALLVTPDGELLPCSQTIRQTAARHVASELFFEQSPSRSQLPPDLLDLLSTATPRNFFERASRLGLRRLTDLGANVDALHLASPFALSSSPAALADPHVAPLLRRAAAVLLNAQLEPLFAFVAARELAFTDVEPLVILPAHTGRAGRLALRAVLRHRGFAPAVIVRRELAAAMSLLETAPCECRVWDLTDENLHVATVAIERDGHERRLRTLQSETHRGLGRTYWVNQIAAALKQKTRLGATPALVDRSLTCLLTRVAEPPLRITFGLLEEVLDAAWESERASDLVTALDGAAIDAAVPIVVTGDLCAIEPVRNVLAMLGAASDSATPVLDRLARHVGAAMLWLRADPARRSLTMPQTGSLRVNSFRGEAVELLRPAQFPAPGEDACFAANFRVAGDDALDRSFLLHVLWGTDSAPEGNATLCAVPLGLDVPSSDDRTLRLDVRLRRSRDGRRLNGRVDARVGSNGHPVRATFNEELTAAPWTAEEMR